MISDRSRAGRGCPGSSRPPSASFLLARSAATSSAVFVKGEGSGDALAGWPGTFPATMPSITDTTCRKNRSRDAPVTSGRASSPHVATNRRRSASSARSNSNATDVPSPLMSTRKVAFMDHRSAARVYHVRY
ncbi:MAG: hypothetical protein Q6365_022010 [Candidatus Sigynarchaeota archaeon]